MKGIIERIRVYSAKGDAGKDLVEARFIENMGLEGDFHALGGERQLTLLLSDCSRAASRDDSAGQKEQGPMGLCVFRFKENLSISNIAPDALRPSVRLELGEAVLEITGETKHCHPECELYQAGKTCSLAGQSLFAKVLKGALIRRGDTVIVK